MIAQRIHCAEFRECFLGSGSWTGLPDRVGQANIDRGSGWGEVVKVHLLSGLGRGSESPSLIRMGRGSESPSLMLHRASGSVRGNGRGSGSRPLVVLRFLGFWALMLLFGTNVATSWAPEKTRLSASRQATGARGAVWDQWSLYCIPLRQLRTSRAMALGSATQRKQILKSQCV